MQNQEQTSQILDQFHNVLRLRHESIQTEGTSVDWIAFSN